MCPGWTADSGGAGGIRTLDRALQPYNGLANRRLQPLGHSSVRADMPDAEVSRKRQIEKRRIREPLYLRFRDFQPDLSNEVFVVGTGVMQPGISDLAV